MALLLIALGLALIVFLGVAFKIYVKLTAGWCRSHVCLAGKTAIITGANTGVGYETALDFAKRGARVILACRDREKAEAARCAITEETGNRNIVVKIIDMASFESVRNFARDINATEDRLDILVNNAGIFIGLGDVRTEDGHSLIMQVNYYSSFLLTDLFKDLLIKSAPSRIVNVSSVAAKLAVRPNLTALDTQIADLQGYAMTKLCNILFTMELARRLESNSVTTYSLHPGTVQTEVNRYAKGITRIILLIVSTLWYKTREEGAQTLIYCSVAKGIERHSGEHFVDCQKVKPYGSAADPTLPKKLWSITDKLFVNKKN